MKQSQSSLGILTTESDEESAQINLSVLIAGLQTVAAGLRTIYGTLELPDEEAATVEGNTPESLALFIRTSIEGTLVDNLEPAIKTLAKAASATAKDFYREWREQQETTS